MYVEKNKTSYNLEWREYLAKLAQIQHLKSLIQIYNEQ
jgi:hypothetical protein